MGRQQYIGSRCGLKLTNRYNLEKHMAQKQPCKALASAKKNHGVETKHYICDQCGLELASKCTWEMYVTKKKPCALLPKHVNGAWWA